MTHGLHPRQAAILKYVTEYKTEHGYSPSVGEIATAVDAAASNVYVHILQLCADGYMTRAKGKARSYNVVKR